MVLNRPRFSVGSFGVTLVPAVEPGLAKPLRGKEKRPTFCRWHNKLMGDGCGERTCCISVAMESAM
jgi:hypothetical protein